MSIRLALEVADMTVQPRIFERHERHGNDIHGSMDVQHKANSTVHAKRGVWTSTGMAGNDPVSLLSISTPASVLLPIIPVIVASRLLFIAFAQHGRTKLG